MTDEPDPVDGIDDVAVLRRENANRRRALREAETERDELRTRPDTVQAAGVQPLAGEAFANPADLLLVTSLDDLRGADGLISTDKAQAVIEATLRDRPHFARAEQLPESRPDLHQGSRAATDPTPLSFGKALRAARS